MWTIDHTNILTYITPAIAIAVLAYSVKFFGKVIADQKPLVDDRSWEIELGGLHFMINLSVSIAIGVTLALQSQIHYTGLLANLLVFLGISVIAALMFAQNAILGEKIYKIKIPILAEGPIQLREFVEEVAQIAQKIPRSLLEIILFYLVTLGFLSNNILWFTIMGGQALFILNFMALNFSLRQIKELPKVDIYLVGVPEPIRNVMLLKVNTDSVRVRKGRRVLVYNKDQILNLDMKLSNKIAL